MDNELVEAVVRAIDDALPESDTLTLAPSQIRRAARAALAATPLAALKAENDALRSALKPFAEACDSVDDERGSIWEHGAAMEITFGDLRQARAALTKQGG